MYVSEVVFFHNDGLDFAWSVGELMERIDRVVSWVIIVGSRNSFSN